MADFLFVFKKKRFQKYSRFKRVGSSLRTADVFPVVAATKGNASAVRRLGGKR